MRQPDWSDPAKPWTFHPISPEQQVRQLHPRHGRRRRQRRRQGSICSRRTAGGSSRPRSRATRCGSFHAQPMSAPAARRCTPTTSTATARTTSSPASRPTASASRGTSRREGRRDQVPRAHHHEQGAEREPIRREVLRAPRDRPRRHGRRRPQGHRHRQALLGARPDRRSRPQRRGGPLLVQARARRRTRPSTSSRI